MKAASYALYFQHILTSESPEVMWMWWVHFADGPCECGRDYPVLSIVCMFLLSLQGKLDSRSLVEAARTVHLGPQAAAVVGMS